MRRLTGSGVRTEIFCFDNNNRKDDIFLELYILLVQNITKGTAAAASIKKKLKENGQINKQHSARAQYSRLIAYIIWTAIELEPDEEPKKNPKEKHDESETKYAEIAVMWCMKFVIKYLTR